MSTAADRVVWGPSRRGGAGAVDLIKQYIVQHRLKPGDPLPTEAELAELLGVSRTIVRESVKTLRALDIVEVRHGYGTFVGQLSLTAMVQSLAFRAVLSAEQDRHMLADLVDLRELLETSLADLFVDKLSQGALLTLRRLTATMQEKAERHEEFLAEDREFHMVLMQATGIDLAVQLNGAFWEVHSIASGSLGPAGDLGASAEAHVHIIDAIDAKDRAGLRTAIAAHYRPVKERMAAADGNDERPETDGVPA